LPEAFVNSTRPASAPGVSSEAVSDRIVPAEPESTPESVTSSVLVVPEFLTRMALEVATWTALARMTSSPASCPSEPPLRVTTVLASAPSV
jgi:hypothetical protein